MIVWNPATIGMEVGRHWIDKDSRIVTQRFHTKGCTLTVCSAYLESNTLPSETKARFYDNIRARVPPTDDGRHMFLAMGDFNEKKKL
jgi:exonuclease III